MNPANAARDLVVILLVALACWAVGVTVRERYFKTETAVEPIAYVDVKPMCGVKRGKDVIAFQCELVNGEWRKLP